MRNRTISSKRLCPGAARSPPNTGHGVNIQEPDRVNRMVEEFVAGVEGAATSQIIGEFMPFRAASTALQDRWSGPDTRAVWSDLRAPVRPLGRECHQDHAREESGLDQPINTDIQDATVPRCLQPRARLSRLGKRLYPANCRLHSRILINTVIRHMASRRHRRLRHAPAPPARSLRSRCNRAEQH